MHNFRPVPDLQNPLLHVLSLSCLLLLSLPSPVRSIQVRSLLNHSTLRQEIPPNNHQTRSCRIPVDIKPNPRLCRQKIRTIPRRLAIHQERIPMRLHTRRRQRLIRRHGLRIRRCSRTDGLRTRDIPVQERHARDASIGIGHVWVDEEVAVGGRFWVDGGFAAE